MFSDFRLKVIRFFRKNSKILFIILCVWLIIFLINFALKRYDPPKKLQTTFKPHTSVMDPKKSVPENVSNPIEDMIEEYVGYCNEGNYQSAYNMLSDFCKEYVFYNDIDQFAEYLATKMHGKVNYAIQDYSNDGNTYIYQLKYSDDMLATGLTNSEYSYIEEKMVFKKQKDGTIDMAVGNFVDFGDIKNISENDYLKVDVKSVVKYYSVEEYTVRFSNRTDNTIVISDGEEPSECVLVLASGDVREKTNANIDIVLEPKESKNFVLRFQKRYDNNDDAKKLTFGAIRVMEKYSGTDDVEDEVIQSEIQNAIAKFSVDIPVTYKN